MVVTFAPSTCQTKTVQDLTALPLTCTTQAPHCEVSQPTWVPVSRRFSRKYCTRRVRGSTSPVTALPFTVNATAVMASSSKSFFAPTREAGGGSGQSRGDLPWDPHSNKSTLNLRRTTGQGCPFHFGCVTAAANL